MSTLTKILVVVGVVLAIFVATVFIAYANYTPNYKALYQGARQEAELAKANYLQAQNKAAAQQAAYAALQGQAAAATDAQQKELDARQKAIADLLATKAQQDSLIESLKASIAGLDASHKEQAAMQKIANEQLAAANKTLMTLNDQLRQLQLANSQLSLDREQLLAQTRVFREQGVEKDHRIRELEEQIATGAVAVGSATGLAPVLTPDSIRPIEATVMTVRPTDNLASLNVGQADGVKVGSRFYLYRGDKLVGELDVQEVDANVSAGLLTNVQMPPQKGDKATNSLK